MSRKIKKRAEDSVPTPPRSQELSGRDLRLVWIGLAVFALAFLVRALVARQLGGLALYRAPQLDQLEFLLWAQGIQARGFSFPALPTKGPGYAYFLSLLLTWTDGSFAAVRWLQSALGAGSAVLTSVLAWRLHRPSRGTEGGETSRPGTAAAFSLAAGLLVAFYGPLVYLDTAFLAEGLFVFLLLATLVALTGRSRGFPAAVTAGLCVAAATLVRATALPLVFLAPLALLALTRGGEAAPRWSPARWRLAAACLAASLALYLPVALQLQQATGSLLLTQGYGGLNLYMGNQPGGEGVPTARLGGSWDRLDRQAQAAGAVTAADQDRYYVDQALSGIREEPGAWLGTLAKKALWLLQADEIRDSHAYGFFRSQSSLLQALPGFGILFSLAAVGLVFGPGRIREPVVWVYAGLFLASCLALIVASRYRIPLIPVLALPAAGGMLVLAGWLPGRGAPRSWRLLLGALAVAVLAFALTRARAHEPSRVFAEEWALSGMAHVKLEEDAAAEEAFERALAEDPGAALALQGFGRLRLAQGRYGEAEELLRRAVGEEGEFAAARLDLGRTLARLGRTGEALEELRRAVELRPDLPAAWEELAPLALGAGDLETAERAYRRILELRGESAPALLALARIEGARRRPAEGMAYARRAAALAPNDPDAWMLTAMLALDAGRAPVAGEALDRVEALNGGPNPQTAFARALLARLLGNRELADGLLRRVLAVAPGMAPARDLLLRNARELGREADAAAFLQSLDRRAAS